MSSSSTKTVRDDEDPSPLPAPKRPKTDLPQRALPGVIHVKRIAEMSSWPTKDALEEYIWRHLRDYRKRLQAKDLVVVEFREIGRGYDEKMPNEYVIMKTRAAEYICNNGISITLQDAHGEDDDAELMPYRLNTISAWLYNNYGGMVPSEVEPCGVCSTSSASHMLLDCVEIDLAEMEAYVNAEPDEDATEAGIPEIQKTRRR